MALSLGATTLSALYLGSTAISTAYLGSVQVYDVGGAFTPADLFASGEEGAWYEPSTTTAFLSTTDLTPCGYGDACGFLLDKSQGAGYSGGSFTGLGSELVTNGTFDTDTDWTKGTGWTIGAGLASKTSGATANLQQSGVYVVGKTYHVQYQVSNYSAGTVKIYAGVSNASPAVSANGTYTYVMTATGDTNLYIQGDASFVGSVDNISVRELPGNHAVQSTSSARPILARIPETGRRNLLTDTDDLATQSVTVTAVEHVLSFFGTGTVTLTGASTAGPLVGTGADDRVSLTFTPSAGSLTLTVSGDVNFAQLEVA